MKTTRSQLKYPLGLQLSMRLKRGIKNGQYSTFYVVTKRTRNSQQTKNQLKLARKRFRSRKTILCLPKYV